MKRTLAVLTFIALAASAAAEKKNVIFILADDLGWADTTLYGKTKLYETPNLERLAKRGMLFDNAYSASPLCSPTRASILTGQTPARTGSTAPNHHMGEVRMKAQVSTAANPGNKSIGTESATRLDTALPTLGKLFKQAGYATGHFGKWHLGPEPFSPLQHGFDVDLPHTSGPAPAGNFVAPWKYKDFDPNKPKEHIEDRMAEEAVKWMKGLPKDQPFFMNYWMFSVHAPFNAKEELIEKYRGKIDPANPQHSPTYAAMVESMDDAIGTLLDAVDEADLAEKTIIVFYSDNGGNMYNGIREKAKDGKEFIVEPTSNVPLRGGKATVYEGGIRVPAIVSWPGLTAPGSRSSEVVQSTDFYPTLLTGMGIATPSGHKVDGTDIAPALKGGKLDRKTIFTYFPHGTPVPDWLPPSIAARSGEWKLIRLFHCGENGAHDYRLYHLMEDIGETKDRSKEKPEIVRELDGLIQAHLDDAKAVVPIANPEFDPAKYRPERIGQQPGGLKVEGQGKKKKPAGTNQKK